MQSRAKCCASRQVTDSYPGEKVVEGRLGTRENILNRTILSSTAGNSSKMIGSGKKEGWPECFQDLGSWCPLPQDELHTPKFTIQDEFNFSIDDGHANDWDLSSPGDLHCDPWGNDTQFGISSCQPVIGELNSPHLQERTPLGVISNTPNLLGSGGKILYTITPDDSRSPLKSKRNVLLSQGIVKTASDDSTYLSMAATLEHKTNSPVVVTNDICLLPITVPDFASAKLNSSSLSTSFLSPPLQSPSPTPPPPIKKISTLREDTISGTLSQQRRLENVHIKEEEQGLEDSFKVPAVSTEGESNEVELIPVKRTEKPQLKLNIAAANNNNVSKFTSSTLSTPEVLRPLVDGDSKEFNLLHYVCNDDEYPDLGQEVEEDSDRNVGDHAIRDHDYTDSWPSSDVKSDVVIKSEPGSPASTSCSISNRSTSKSRARRKRQHDDSSDYIASDSDESVSDDSQQEWSPTPAKKRSKRKSSTSSTKTSKTGTRKRTAGGRRSSQTSGQGGSNTGQDKYRALRERNNEASRRSRMNRKQRDVEMLHTADDLLRKNVNLKARAEKMENLVKYMRAEIMKALTKR